MCILAGVLMKRMYIYLMVSAKHSEEACQEEGEAHPEDCREGEVYSEEEACQVQEAYKMEEAEYVLTVALHACIRGMPS